MLTRPTRRSFLTMAAASATATMFGSQLRALAASGEIDEIKWALPSVPNTLFVPHAWSTYIGAIMSLVQEGMLAFGDDLSLEPATADHWEQTDPTTFKYHLRQGVTFGDGSPLTPDDIVATTKFHLDPNSGSQLSAFYSSVASVDATGPAEVTVKLKSPNVQFRYTAAHMAGFIFQKKQLEAHGKDIGTPDVLVLGTGPYKLTEFAPGDHAVVEANPAYWGTKAVAKKITFQAIADRQTRLLAMQNGDIEGAVDIAVLHREKACLAIGDRLEGDLLGHRLGAPIGGVGPQHRVGAADEVFQGQRPDLLAEGGAVKQGETVIELAGSTRSILTGERVALNFLQRLSGVATLTAQFVRAVQGTGAQILDTRKTTPGLRALEKAAVKAGGGRNHRMGLYDAVMVKDNHLLALPKLQETILLIRKKHPAILVELEADSVEQVREFAVLEGVDVILLDNMSAEQMEACVAMRRPGLKVEASGGVSLDTVREIAETGVDYI